jgi:hypothetical protein
MLPETLRARSRNQPRRRRAERLGRREIGGDGQAADGTKAAGTRAYRGDRPNRGFRGDQSDHGAALRTQFVG